MSELVDHWYQIHVKATSNSLSGITRPQAIGPLDRGAMLAQVQEILEGRPVVNGYVPHYAQVTRTDVGCGVLYERKRGGWVRVKDFAGLPALPVRLGDAPHIPMVTVAEHGHLLLSASDLDDMTARQFVSSADGADPVALLRNFPYNRALVMQTTMTPYREVGVDLNLVCERLQTRNYPDTFPESSSQLHPPSLDMGSTPIVGFRSWRLNICSQIVDDAIVDAEPRLYGPNYWLHHIGMYRWHEAEKTAECNRDDHISPDGDCACGLYAWHDMEAAIDYRASGPELSLTTMVRGAVLGSGRVLVHKDGWRSQYARIIGFDGDHLDDRFRPGLQRLAAKFEVPIVGTERLLQRAEKKGQVIRKSDLESPELD